MATRPTLQPSAKRSSNDRRPRYRSKPRATCCAVWPLSCQSGERRCSCGSSSSTHPTLFAKHLSAYAGFERALGDAIAERLGRFGGDDADELYPSVVAAAVTAATKAALQHWMQDAGRVPLSDVVEAAFAHLQHLDSYRAVPAPIPFRRAAGES